MIFKEVKLTHNAWHYKLLTWMWGTLPPFNNFCPYFWLTVASCILAPFFAIAKGLKWAVIALAVGVVAFFKVTEPFWVKLGDGLAWCFEGFATVMDNYVCLPLERQTLGWIDDERIMDLYMHSRDRYMDRYNYDAETARIQLLSNADDKRQMKRWARMDAKFQVWKSIQGDDWKEKLKAVAARENERVKEEAARDLGYGHPAYAEPTYKSQKQQLNDIAMFAKKAVTVLIALACIPLAWGLFRLLIVIIKLPWLKILYAILGIPMAIVHGIIYGVLVIAHAWLAILMAIGILLAMLGFAFLIVHLMKKCDLEVPLRAIGRAFSHVFGGIVDFFGFMIQGFKMWKRDNCPQIIWED